jgi:bifunctional DNA-binding transcriptional regulator/antitoxin component of YhaV-PrlF toxin-antitoxin module
LQAPHGGPWTYTLEQARFILWYAALDKSGQFLYHSAVLQRLKGHGKDPLAAALGSTDLCCEDAEFDHWDGDVPVGRERPAPWVQILAVSQVQTQNTMKLFPGLIPPETRRKYGIQIGKLNVWARGDEAQIEAATASVRAIEGGRPTTVIRGETQNWLQANGGHDMAGALEGNAAKSNVASPARVLDICNAYRPGEDSVAERVRDAWEKTQGDPDAENAADRPEAMDFGLLYDSLEAPPEAPLSAEAAPEVVRSIAGDSVWLDTRPSGRIVKSILNPSNPASESRRKWYNQITAAEDAWADPNDVKAAEETDARLVDGDVVVLFGDGSKSDDATALVACRVDDGFCQLLHIQQPRKGENVDRDAVDHAVVEAFGRFKVRAFWFDPSHARDDDDPEDAGFWWPMVDAWARRYGRRLKCHPVKSGNKAHAVAFDMATPSAHQTFVQGCEQTLTELEAGEVAFARSTWLRQHLVNCKRAPGRFGVSVRKDHRESAKKIDAAVCLIGARTLRRIFLLSQKKGTPGKGRVIVMQ